MKYLLLALVACSKREPHDDKAVVTQARALEVRCELGKDGEPPPGFAVALGDKRVWAYGNDAIRVRGEKGLVAAITPPAPNLPLAGAASVAHGLAMVVRGKGTWYLAQLDLGGAPHGAMVALPGVAPEVGAMRVGAFADTVVLLEQTTKGSLIQAYSLDAKPVGDALDLGAIGIDDFARIGTSHAFLVRYREHSNTPEQLRIYDGDARAWAGPAFESKERIKGTVPFGDAMLLVGFSGDDMVAVTLDAKGTQSAAKTLHSDAAMEVEPPLAGPDHAYAVWITAQKDVHVAQILPDLRLGPDVSFPGDGGNPATNTASESTIYLNGKRITCR